MSATRGYYSVMQYCPDASRLEAANVGVVLFCPERHFLQVKVVEGNDRIARFFGRASFDAERVNDAKQAIVDRLHTEREQFRTLEDWTQFVETRANAIRLTPPRPLKVVEPVTDLERLFDKLVGARQPQASPGTGHLRTELRKLFSRPDLKNKILKNEQVRVPVTGTVLQAPYAFRNGVLNLVRPLTMTANTMTEATKLVVDGNLLNKHPQDMQEPAKLLIAIAAPESAESRKQRETLERLFADYNVTSYREEQLDELAEYVKTAAH